MVARPRGRASATASDGRCCLNCQAVERDQRIPRQPRARVAARGYERYRAVALGAPIENQTLALRKDRTSYALKSAFGTILVWIHARIVDAQLVAAHALGVVQHLLDRGQIV